MSPVVNRSSPRISVIVPTFNRDWILREAIESVLAQTFKDLELIVVDDGSEDATQKLLAAYGSRIRVHRQENRGVSSARNAGIAMARGSLVALLDSDDTWLPTKLERQVAFMDSRPGVLISQTEEIWIRNGRRVNPARKHRKPSGLFFERSLEMCMVSPSAVMMRRGLIETVGPFDESLPACEDYDLWLRIGCRFPIWLLDEPLVVKTGGHGDQLSGGWGLDRYRIRSIRNCLEAGILTPDQRDAAVRVLRRKCRIYADGCRKRGRHGEADRYEAIARSHRR
ncbi:MAG: glycosyltransferase [Desulfobacterales bacterium]|jgi:glycosyltransferase involved in cell wall biosynthesis